MSSGLLKSACLSVGLASAWAPSAEADILTRVHFQSELSGGVTNALILLGSLGSGSPGGLSGGVVYRGLSLPGMGSGSMEFDIPTAEFGDLFAMIGITGGSGDARLIITAGGGSGLLDLSFEEAFPGYSEAAMIAALYNNEPAAEDFVRAHYASLRGVQGNLINAVAFRPDGAPYGHVMFEAVSVPAPGAMVVVGFGVLTLRRRRR